MRVVAFYTPAYAAEADLLVASLRRLGLPHAIEQMTDRGSWDRNTAAKPAFCLRMREALSGPLLYVDVDAFVHHDPTAWVRDHLAHYGIDFAAHWFAGPRFGWDETDLCGCLHGQPCTREHWLLSGTLYLGDTAGCRELLARWVARNAERAALGKESGGGQRNLWEMFSEGALVDLRTRHLPGRFTRVFDKPWGYPEDEPVWIEHTIASRDHRSGRRKQTPARWQRKEELRALVGLQSQREEA